MHDGINNISDSYNKNKPRFDLNDAGKTNSSDRDRSVYVVEKGDTLYSISKIFETNYQNLATHNGISNPNVIFPEQKIRVPNSPSKSSLTSPKPLDFNNNKVDAKPNLVNKKNKIYSNAELEFDIGALKASGVNSKVIDSVVNNRNYDGEYLVSTTVNNQNLGMFWLTIVDGITCISGQVFKTIDWISDDKRIDHNDCAVITDDIDVNFNLANLELNLIIPDKYISDKSRRYVKGGKAVTVDYNLYYNRKIKGTYSDRDTLLGYTNLSAQYDNWIFNSRQNYTDSSGITNMASYVQSDFVDMGLRFQAGRVNLESELLSAFQFDGIQLTTNKTELENHRLGRINGDVSQVSTITVKQGGTVIYSTMLPAGNYELAKIPLVNTSDNLVVTIVTESNQTSTFEVPPSAYLVQGNGESMLNSKDYFLSLGRSTSEEGVNFVSGGANFYTGDNLLSKYSFGGLLSDDRIVNLGAQANGRFSDKLSYSTYHKISYIDLNNAVYHGVGNSSQIRLSYSGLSFANLNISYRLQSKNFLNAGTISSDTFEDSSENVSLKNAFSIAVAAPLFNSIGSISASYYRTERYNSGVSDSFRIYATSKLGRVNTNLSVEKLLDSSDGLEFKLTVNVPFDVNGYKGNSYSHYSKDDDSSALSTNFSLTRDDTQYQAYASAPIGDNVSQYSLGAYTTLPYARVGARYSDSSYSQAISLNASGGAAIVDRGLALTNSSIADTFAVMEIKDADTGYAITNTALDSYLPYTSINSLYIQNSLSPYQQNTIKLPDNYLPQNYDNIITNISVKPMTGSVITGDFYVRDVLRLLLTVYREDVLLTNGDVFDKDNNFVGELDRFGQIFLSGSKVKSGGYKIRFSNKAVCELNIDFKTLKSKKDNYYRMGDATCEV
jgi:outer membrane usher protein FimD/PapC